jgi:hypothetical protein
MGRCPKQNDLIVEQSGGDDKPKFTGDLHRQNSKWRVNLEKELASFLEIC